VTFVLHGREIVSHHATGSSHNKIRRFKLDEPGARWLEPVIDFLEKNDDPIHGAKLVLTVCASPLPGLGSNCWGGLGIGESDR
jgi:hypothetical protein